jgi:lysophospholipase L1-like esterase
MNWNEHLQMTDHDDVHRAATRIVVIGDSLVMPRPSEGGIAAVPLEATWPRRLQQRLMHLDTEVVVFGQRERTSRHLATDLQQCIEFNIPEIVVLQIGVVDAAPRIISWQERRVLRFVPSRVRHEFIEHRKHNRQATTAANPLGKVYVPPDEFSQRITAFVTEVHNLLPTTQLFAVPIVADVDAMEKKSPGYGSNLFLYNRLLASVRGLEVVPVPRLSSSSFMADGYHLGVSGNALVAKAVADRLVPVCTR